MDGQLQYMHCQSYCCFTIFIYSWFPIGFNVLLCFVFVRSPFIPVLLRIRRWQNNTITVTCSLHLQFRKRKTIRKERSKCCFHQVTDDSSIRSSAKFKSKILRSFCWITLALVVLMSTHWDHYKLFPRRMKNCVKRIRNGRHKFSYINIQTEPRVAQRLTGFNFPWELSHKENKTKPWNLA